MTARTAPARRLPGPSLKTRPADGRAAEIDRLNKVGDLTMANELLATKIEYLEAGRPLARRRSRR